MTQNQRDLLFYWAQKKIIFCGRRKEKITAKVFSQHKSIQCYGGSVFIYCNCPFEITDATHINQAVATCTSLQSLLLFVTGNSWHALRRLRSATEHFALHVATLPLPGCWSSHPAGCWWVLPSGHLSSLVTEPAIRQVLAGSISFPGLGHRTWLLSCSKCNGWIPKLF